MALGVLIAGFMLQVQEQEKKNEAEELLKKSSEKLASLKSFQCKAQLIVHGPVGDVTMEQTFRCAAGNKLFFEIKGKHKDKELKQWVVSDGAKVTSDRDEKRTEEDTPDDLNSQVLAMMARVSLMGAVESMTFKVLGGDKPMECLTFSDFKMGKAEKGADRELQSITYKVTQTKPTRATSSVETPVALWIDSKTLFPVKRELKVKLGSGDHILKETFTEVHVDEKIDPAKFELPK